MSRKAKLNQSFDDCEYKNTSFNTSLIPITELGYVLLSVIRRDLCAHSMEGTLFGLIDANSCFTLVL